MMSKTRKFLEGDIKVNLFDLSFGEVFFKKKKKRNQQKTLTINVKFDLKGHKI